MKKLFVMLAFVLMFGLNVQAMEIGTKISDAVYTDVQVCINHYPIPTYSVNGYAVVVAEDLADYCCDVIWNGEDRTLKITKSVDKTEFTTPRVYKPISNTGDWYADVLYTDIKTYVNDTLVSSFSINGRTMIVADDLGLCMDGCTWVPELRTAKVWIDGKHVKDYEPLPNRVLKLFYDGNYNSTWTDYMGTSAYDMNFDGVSENIVVDIMGMGGYPDYMRVNIGNFSTQIEVFEATIEAAFVCDIDTSDGVMDLAVMTMEYSGDPHIYIFRYDEELSRYKFKHVNLYDNYFAVEEFYGLGYVDDYYFNIRDDGSIMMKCMTPSDGMWSVLKVFYRDEYGVFVEKVPEYYVIQSDFMKQRLEWDDSLYGYERTMWEKGYVKAHSRFSSNGLTINQGEYFRVLYDNGNNYVYIQKENGVGGWVYMGYDASGRYELNEPYFYLAG